MEEPADHTDPTLERTGKFFGGLIADIKRKAPWYLSDYKDGIHIQCLASFFFMYFACLTPIITFGGLLGAATEENMVTSYLLFLICSPHTSISGCYGELGLWLHLRCLLPFVFRSTSDHHWVHGTCARF
jgi:hypothetical protein